MLRTRLKSQRQLRRSGRCSGFVAPTSSRKSVCTQRDGGRAAWICVTATQHVQHEKAFEQLEALLRAIEMSSVSDLDARMLDLYHSLALFVAENFQHMDAKEHENNETLWAIYSDAELHALHAEIMAFLDPVKMVNFTRWILPYVSHRERAAMLAGMHKAAPVPVSHLN